MICKKSLPVIRNLLSSRYSLGTDQLPRHYSQLLTPRDITDILTKDQATINGTNNSTTTASSSGTRTNIDPNTIHQHVLPSCVKSVECNQIAANDPIEDRIRIASIQLPNTNEPTLIGAVFDGHGGDTTADFVSSRLFSYIALALHPNLEQLDQADKLESFVNHLHSSPNLEHDQDLRNLGIRHLMQFKNELQKGTRPHTVEQSLKASFNQCDLDLSKEIQHNLTGSASRGNRSLIHYYMSAAVSGCCAIVLVVQEGIGYLASSGDCRAVLGTYRNSKSAECQDHVNKFDALELNDEHNCDNIHEVRRLAAAHPKSELNTIIRHNRLLGHLMPFRAFGDFTYKWPESLINACGITRAYGAGVIPSHYNTPPYLTAEPDVTSVGLSEAADGRERSIVIASDGLWELFESSREVIEAIAEHSESLKDLELSREVDGNSATHLLRTALSSIREIDSGLESNEVRKQRYIRLVSMLTLPKGVARNFRDDISALVIKLA